MNDHHHGALISQLARASAEAGQSTGRNLALALLPLLIASLLVLAG